MKEAGFIDNKVVSFFIGSTYHQSKVQFGGFDNYYIKQGD
jgi:hypothetical protein